MSNLLLCKCLRMGWGRFSDISYLSNSLRTKEKLGIHKALQFIGDVHLMENNEVTAVNLFTGHCLGGIYLYGCSLQQSRVYDSTWGHSQEEWPLFERSSQATRVQDTYRRIDGISKEVKEQHRKNMARLAEAGKVKEVDEDSTDAEER
ncbi:hypothetical protein C8F04DRAFT_1188121 [Mycena alexandri]|uniref:Uncharacterized protein n=1 Tax=Mycena alexandri TaxID=1745969 RepID=A0AAD6WXM4_9AGAR|nr:hypothetical protein C8F04DRAFT_1188121 [Mycena alexandri]